MFLFNSGLRVLLTLPSGAAAGELATICALAIVPFVAVSILSARLAAAHCPPHRFKQLVLTAAVAIGVHAYVLGVT